MRLVFIKNIITNTKGYGTIFGIDDKCKKTKAKYENALECDPLDDDTVFGENNDFCRVDRRTFFCRKSSPSVPEAWPFFSRSILKIN